MDTKPKAPSAPAPTCLLAAGVDIARDRFELPCAGSGRNGAQWQRLMLTRNTPPAGGDPDERRQPQVGGRGIRSLALSAESYDAEARTVEAVLSAGTAVRRYYFTEELEISAEAIDLARVTGGICPLLDTHNQYQLDAAIGRVLSVRIESGKLIGVLQFADTVAGRAIEARVAAGELRAISIGYRVTRWQITATDESDHETWRAVAWELLEASFVSVPADPNAVVRSAPGSPAHGNHEEEDMRRNLPGGAAAAVPATPAAAAPAAETRADTAPVAPVVPAAAIDDSQRQQAPVAITGADVRTAVRNAGLGDDVALDLLERHATQPLSRDALLADIGRRFAERDSGATTVNRVSVTRDEGDTMRRGMGDALSHRFAPGSELSEQGRAYRGMGMLRMAEELLASRGVSVRGMTAHEIAERSLHSTSDFPSLVGGALNRRLRASYEESKPTYRIWARRAPNAPDFKTIDVVQMSAMPDLSPVGEGGEFKYGTASDGKVSYKMATYGKIIGFTRQMIVNDDLRALDRVVSGFAGSAARLENRIVYGLLAANATINGAALFHADHGNLGTAAHVSDVSLKASRGRMRLQKGLQNEELNIAPRYLLVPTTEEQAAYTWTSSNYVPAKATDVNEFRTGGRTAIEPVVDAVLDSITGTAWFTAADSAQCDTIEYCYLDGAEGVQMSSRMGFTVDGVEFKASLDFASAVIDHRGLDKNPGTA